MSKTAKMPTSGVVVGGLKEARHHLEVVSQQCIRSKSLRRFIA